MKKIILLIVLFTLAALSILVYAARFEAEVTIYEGWNLVYGFANPEQLDGQKLEKQHIKAIYAFIPNIQQYARVYPNPENNKIDKIGDGYLIRTAMWVYSDKTERTEYWIYDEPWPLEYLNEIRLYKGWNFVGVIPAFAGLSLNEIKGTCDIQKAYAFEEIDNKWVSFDDVAGARDDKKSLGENALMLKGIVVKVPNDCNLGVSVIGPPTLPPS